MIRFFAILASILLLPLTWGFSASLTVLPVEQTSTGLALTFGRNGTDRTGWVVLPPGSQPWKVDLWTNSGHKRLDFAHVNFPAPRYAFQIPSGVRELRISGLVGRGPLRSSTRAPKTPGWVLSTMTEATVNLPRWTSLAPQKTVVQVAQNSEKPWTVSVEGESRAERTLLPKGQNQWNFYGDAWGFSPDTLTISKPVGLSPTVTVGAIEDQSPLPADPATFLRWPKGQWRNPDREWFRWQGTQVLVLVTADYAIQDDYLRRLAFFVEKAGFRGRIVSDSELEGLHGWNAHDYGAPDLARFFTLAEQQGFALNPRERELRDWLTQTGILIPAGPSQWNPGAGALVGVSDESPPALKTLLFVHEGYHGLYFTTPSFREGVKTVWDGLPEGARQAFRTYLSRSRYDPNDEALMINEFQAYVLQRIPRYWNEFFGERVLDQVEPETRLVWLESFRMASEALDALVGRLFHLSSGKITSISWETGGEPEPRPREN